MDRIVALWAILLASISGCTLGAVTPLHLYGPAPVPRNAHVYPLPHHVAKQADGVSLRYAMVHDVLHKRFARHGTAFYEERNRRVRDQLEQEKAKHAAGAKPSAAYFGLLDDLGVGLDLLGAHEAAIELMRAKLKEQESLGLMGRDLYSTYANLGTFLILWQLQKGLANDLQAKPRLDEGLGWIHQAIAVNPESHFGREVWQAVILEFLIAVIEEPRLLLEFDMIGNRLDAEVNPAERRSYQENYGMLASNRQAKHLLEHGEDDTLSVRKRIREKITQVGAEEGWTKKVKSSHKQPVPFDEPALGIIGMWRLGGGANPHFALALGETMLRIGQRYIAWEAYERAAQLGKHVWPDADVHEAFVRHCRRRQQLIEQQLPAEEVKRLRPQFEAELAFGKRYQDAYHAFEAAQIRKGVPLTDEHFYEAFHAEHGAIASPIGPSDRFVAEHANEVTERIVGRKLAFMLTGAGLLGIMTALALQFWARRRPAAVAPS